MEITTEAILAQTRRQVADAMAEIAVLRAALETLTTPEPEGSQAERG